MTRLEMFQSAWAEASSRLSGRGRLRMSKSAIIKYGLRIAGIIFLALIVMVGALAAIILSGPTEFGLVRNRIEAILERSLGDRYDISVGSAVLDVDPVYGLIVQVNNVTVRDDRKAVVANMPSTRVDIDPFGLFLLRVDIEAVEFNDAELDFVRSDTGEVYLGNAETTHADAEPSTPQGRALPVGPEGGFPDLVAGLQILDKGIEPAIRRASDGGLRRVSFNNGTVQVWDAARSQLRRFPESDLSITVDPVTTTFSANFSTSGFGGQWTAEVSRDVDAGTGARTMSAVFSNLTIADIIPKLGDSDSPVTADIPLYGRAMVHYDSEGVATDASARLDFGAGLWRFQDGRESVRLDEATVKLAWDAKSQAIVVEPSTFFFGETRGMVSGRIVPEGDVAEGRYRFDLRSRGTILAPGDSPEAPLIAQEIAVIGIADIPGRLLNFDNAHIQTPVGSIAAAGSLGFEASTPSLAIAASFSGMPVAAAKQMWIPMIAPGARRWVMNHVLGGRIASGTFEAAVPGGFLWTGVRRQIPEDMMRLNLKLEDISFDTIGELPPVVEASGNAVLAGSTFGVDLEKGRVKVPSGKMVEITAGAFAVANTAPRFPEGIVEVQLAGDASAMGEIADAKPFRTLEKQKMSPSDLSGTADAAVSIRMPLRPDVTEADVDWRVTIDGKRLASAVPIVERKVSDADVTMVVTPEDVTVRGTARIDGVPADIDFNRPLNGNGDFAAGAGQQMVRLTLDDAARKRLGIGLEDILAGSVGTYVSHLPDGGEGQHYDLDLKQARLVLPGLGWSKGVGVPASLSFDLKPIKEGYAVEKIVLEGADFGFQGSARLDSKYGLVSADISRFALRKGDSLGFKLTRGKTGYAITANGSSFDMRGFLKNAKATSGGGSAPDLNVEARLGRLIGFGDEQVGNAAISLVWAGGTMRKLAFAGTLGNSDISANYTDSGDSAVLQVSSPEGGRVLRFTDFYSRIDGGNLRIEARRAGRSGPLVGRFNLSNFEIVGEPAMQHVVASSQGNQRTGFDPSRVHFDRMVVNFNKTEQAVVISDALLRGAAVGATFNGRYDLASTGLSINGTYLPAYNINNVFGRLPIIGLALGGGSSGGLIGVTFKVEGTIAEPRLFINPLSAVAPGIFRKIFEFQ